MINKLNTWPKYSEEDIQVVKNILLSSKVNYLNGCEGNLFENEFSNFVGTKYSLSTSSGTVGLDLAYSALNLKNGDEIITSPRGYIATASVPLRFGAKIIFAEVDRNSGLITPETIYPLITNKTKAISVVHLGGWPARMNEILKLAKSQDIRIIEDCAQAHGAKINGKSVGSFGDISVWSFCQDKIISTAGEGGMVTTNNKEYWEKMWSLRDQGKSRELLEKQKNNIGFKWIHENCGLNYRLTEIQSAIGRNQLRKLTQWNLAREKNALSFIKALSEEKLIRIPYPKVNERHGWYKLYVYLNSSELSENWTRDRVIESIQSKGYPAFSGSCPEIYKEKLFSKMEQFRDFRLPIAKELGETSLMFLVHPTISKSQIEGYINAVKETLNDASK